jgi:hypothetical protein
VSDTTPSTDESVARARGYIALLLLVLYRLARYALAGLALAQWIGTAWALLVMLLVAAVRWTVLIQLGACIALVRIAHWPLFAAVLAVAPRLLLVLPGLINTWLASMRHPRPRWSAADPNGPRAAIRASNLPSA